jgi:hypothetical protein
MDTNRRRTTVPAFLAVLLGVGAALVPGSPQAGPAAAAKPRIDPRAADTLKKMSAYLAATQSFVLEAEESFDEVSAGDPRVQLGNVRRLTVERPNHFTAQAAGDTLNRSAWYDGRALSVLDKDKNAYVTMDMPGTIDAVVDKIAADYGIVLPLSDFVYSNPYDALVEGVGEGRYLGIHSTGGFACHHLAFSQDDADWQIWIDSGAAPVPRKLVISYVQEAGVPQYTAVIKTFEAGAKASADAFRFTPPAGARKLEPADFLAARATPSR